ncbi:MAG: translational GTPase TypA [Bdellovibrionota bacterium]
MTKIRNICIIAHVDHGKTTLVDHLLRQAGTFKRHQALEERVMDSMDLERERGITIMAKNTSIRLGEMKINIVDTPGHADFGGEVERIMGMVDGAILLVDAAEGPLPQTRFVLQKALNQGLKILVVINKVDRPECSDGLRIQEVVNHTFDLFVDLGANEEQLDFPIVYACGREGWCTTNFDEIMDLVERTKHASLQPLFELILNSIPAPRIVAGSEFKMLVSNLSYSDYVGRLAVGRILSGSARKNQKLIRHGVDHLDRPKTELFQVQQIYTFEGLEQAEVAEITAGDIAVLAGSEAVEIGDTLSSLDNPTPLPRIYVEHPTLGMTFSVNTSPLSGKEGDAIQSRKLRERLIKEVCHNVALRFQETAQPDQFRILGRGELQFAVLIEQMRREGFEFMVGKPLVLYRNDESGNKLEPFERAVLDLPEVSASEVTQLFLSRKGIMTKFENRHSSRVRLEFEIPARGLLGIRSRYLTLTRGAGLFSTQLLGYRPHKGEIIYRLTGSLISDRSGETVEYGLLNLEDRGILFVGPGIQVYEGMIIGECNKENDLNVNPCKEKKLTNIRAAHAEFLVTLAGIRQMSLEQCIEWIDEDEWIEVTPKSIRLRKKVLHQNQRSVKRSERIN